MKNPKQYQVSYYPDYPPVGLRTTPLPIKTIKFPSKEEAENHFKFYDKVEGCKYVRLEGPGYQNFTTPNCYKYPYSVELYGSDGDIHDFHDPKYDQLWEGKEFTNLEDAMAYLYRPLGPHDYRFYRLVCNAISKLDTPQPGDPDFIGGLWPGGDLARENENWKPDDPSDDYWRKEQAMMAGMAHGCQGYNDYMGYDLDVDY